MMHRLFIFIVLHLFTSQIISQSNHAFRSPVDIPMYLSGNFGEIRDDHFHSGIDIKTGGVTGYEVHSIEEGYVSRIKVQANGYGKSIYVSHPTGHTSLYGHLDRYHSDIADYVKKIQYERRSHAVDIYLKPGQFRLNKGDVVGYSGNTGSSSGPHLHFEIRTTEDQHPTNVLKYGFDIRDRIPPRFHRLFLYPLGDSSHVMGSPGKFSTAVLQRDGQYLLPSVPEVKAGGTIGVGAEVFDYLDGAPNRCGVYTLSLYVNGDPVYSHVLDEFSFSETRFINAHIDYGERSTSGAKVHRLYRLPNDRLRIYRDLVSDGMIRIRPDGDYHIRMVASDVAGNSSELQFRIRGEPALPFDKNSLDESVQRMPYHRINRFSSDGVQLEIPAYALYEDLDFSFSAEPAPDGMHSGLYRIHSPETPVHLPFRLSVMTESPDPAHPDRYCLVRIDQDGEKSYAGGTFSEGAVTAEVRSFGTYGVVMDTIPPEIVPLDWRVAGDFRGASSIRFRIIDDLSGIDQYEGFIDNDWALFEYDPKNELLTCVLDPARVDQGSLHELELYVTDACGNVNLYHTTFRW